MTGHIRIAARTLTRRSSLAASRVVVVAVVAVAGALSALDSNAAGVARAASAAVVVIGLGALAILTLSDVISRLDELSLRRALGASGVALLVPEIVICAALSSTGAALGWVSAGWVFGPFVFLDGERSPIHLLHVLRIVSWVTAASAAVMLATVTSALAWVGGRGLAPPLTMSAVRRPCDEGLQRMRSSLVAGHIALTTVLVASAVFLWDTERPRASAAVPAIGECADPIQTHAPDPAFLVAFCGMFGLLLASLSAYGTTARSSVDRAREAGVRLALGEGPHRVWWSVAAVTLGSIARGAALGTAAAAIVTVVLSAAAMQAGSSGWRGALVAAGLAVGAAAAATIAAARQAAAVDPLRAMHGE